MTATGLAKEDASDKVNLANAINPKYATRILFPRLMAYILGRPRSGREVARVSTAYLKVMKMSEDNKKNTIKST